MTEQPLDPPLPNIMDKKNVTVNFDDFLKTFNRYGMSEIDATAALLHQSAKLLVDKYGEEIGSREFMRIADAIVEKKLWERDIRNEKDSKPEPHLKIVK